MDLITLYLQRNNERTIFEEKLAREKEERVYFGTQLRIFRLELNVSVKRVAESLGISPRRIRRLERGERVRDFKLLRNAYQIYLDLINLNESQTRLRRIDNLREIEENMVIQFCDNVWNIPINILRNVI